MNEPNNSEQNKPAWLENHFCRFNDGEHSCECSVDGYKTGKEQVKLDLTPEPPEPWEESFDENYPTGLYVRHETCDCCGLEPTPPEEVTEDVKAFIRKVHDQAYERGKKEGVMIAFNLIDDSAPKFEEEAKKTDDGETWLLARSLRRVRKWLNLELPKYLTKPSSD